MGCGSGEPAQGAVVPVNVHTLAGCEPPTAKGSLELLALGDFDASNESAEVLAIEQPGTRLKFPFGTRAIEARFETEGARFIGYAERGEAPRFDVLLWPDAQTCSVLRPDEQQGYPGKHGGQAVGYSRRHGVVLAAGGNDALVSDAVVGALTFDASTGASAAFDTSQDGVLREARAFATTSELGEKLLIAGGENPIYGVSDDDLEPRATAELFDPKLGAFSGELIQLNARTRHAAVTLANGDVLLVGGRSRFNDSTVELRPCEVVSADDLRVTPVATLRTGRIAPTALRLSDDRVFVGGGYLLDGSLARPGGEWLSADGRENQHPADGLPLRGDRAFVATAGGGVLAVGGCEEREPETEDESAACSAACQRGCPPRDQNGNPHYDAWWLPASGVPTEVSMLGIAAPRPILLPGSDGSPWLVAALASVPETPRLFRFNPWREQFVLVDAAAGLRLPVPGMPAPVAIDPDAFVWLAEARDRAELVGLRLGTRSRYAQDLALVLLSDPEDPSRPLHLVPDRPLVEGEAYDGRLWLSSAASGGGVTVSIADTVYADFGLSIELSRPSKPLAIPNSVPPLVLLGELELGGEACPWPEGAPLDSEDELPTLVRLGDDVELRFHGGSQHCPVGTERMPLSLRAGAGVSVISKLNLQRTVQAPP